MFSSSPFGSYDYATVQARQTEAFRRMVNELHEASRRKAEADARRQEFMSGNVIEHDPHEFERSK